MGGKNAEALKLLLSSAPMGSSSKTAADNQAEKDAALAMVMRVLISVKSANQVESVVKQLDQDQRDILMKYIYRGFENPNDGSSVIEDDASAALEQTKDLEGDQDVSFNGQSKDGQETLNDQEVLLYDEQTGQIYHQQEIHTDQIQQNFVILQDDGNGLLVQQENNEGVESEIVPI